MFHPHADPGVFSLHGGGSSKRCLAEETLSRQEISIGGIAQNEMAGRFIFPRFAYHLLLAIVSMGLASVAWDHGDKLSPSPHPIPGRRFLTYNLIGQYVTVGRSKERFRKRHHCIGHGSPSGKARTDCEGGWGVRNYYTISVSNFPVSAW